MLARPLAEALRIRGWSVWFDEFELALGDSLRTEIDRGLSAAQYGLVILSPSFFGKQWPQRELDGLVAREVGGSDRKVILPVWHEVDHSYVASFSPPLADRMAIQSTAGIEKIIAQVEYVLRTTASSSIVTEGAESTASRSPNQTGRLQSARTHGRLEGPILLIPPVHRDARGFFSETYVADVWAAQASPTLSSKARSRARCEAWYVACISRSGVAKPSWCVAPAARSLMCSWTYVADLRRLGSGRRSS